MPFARSALSLPMGGLSVVTRRPSTSVFAIGSPSMRKMFSLSKPRLVSPVMRSARIFTPQSLPPRPALWVIWNRHDERHALLPFGRLTGRNMRATVDLPFKPGVRSSRSWRACRIINSLSFRRLAPPARRKRRSRGCLSSQAIEHRRAIGTLFQSREPSRPSSRKPAWRRASAAGHPPPVAGVSSF